LRVQSDYVTLSTSNGLKSFFTNIIFCLFAIASYAHGGDHPIKFQENKGQWGKELLFFARGASMDVFVGEGKFMIGLKNTDDMALVHDIHHGLKPSQDEIKLGFHNIEFQLIDPNFKRAIGQGETEDYVNYFLGNDPSKWAGGVKQFEEVKLPRVYEGVDFILSSLGDYLKYEFQCASHSRMDLIQFKINGADNLELVENQLLLHNSIDLLTDDRPVAWQLINGQKRFVDCYYTLSGDTLGFEVPGYNPDFPIIIDPTLIFASYTGSGDDNWGSTATYDSTGNLYAGGIVVNPSGNNYPYTTGAFQTSYQGGSGGLGTDIVISKFNSSGTSLVYSTYLGGASNEIPHSLVVNANSQLYVLGTTSSSDFPTTSSAYDQSFNGGSSIAGGGGTNQNSNSISYPNGSDIIVTKFSANGTALVASSFIGGAGNDGINQSDVLQKAYSDEFRGEIIVDANDNCYVATSTGSSNFPIVSGFQSTYGGGVTDGVVFKFNSGLSSLLWSSFIGGSDDDGAYSLQFDPNLNVFATGGTKSSNFPTTNGVINPSYNGGTADGWVAKINNNGTTLLASTFLGTNNYDQSFFVQLDLQGNVYVVGQTLGAYPIGPSWVYSVANSGQFLHKLSNNLQNTVFSTRWGTGGNAINLSLSAFLVNQCNHIFVAGWGGSLFGTNSSTSSGSTTSGLPTTSNAVKTTTDGNDMYFIVFEDSAKAVLFASFYGGNNSNTGREHVDGGTSRFDKKGIIYQAVCAGCGGGGNGSFPTTSGSVATSNGSSNCNLGVIKYDLVTLEADADINGPTQVCVNDSVEFDNQSFGGSLYLWEFGDGFWSDEFEPKHAYTTPGNYTVRLIIYDSVSCIFADTDYIQLTVTPGPQASVTVPPPVCPDVQVQLFASGGTSYAWSPAGSLNDPNIADPKAMVLLTTTFIVSVMDSCGVDTAHVLVRIHADETEAMPDTAICRGLFGTLRAEGGLQYFWSPGRYLSSTSSARPICTPDSSIWYTVTIIDSFQCKRDHEVHVLVDGFLPEISAWGDTNICQGDRIVLNASGTDNYEWIPPTWVLDPFVPSTPAYPEESVNYVAKTFNSCGSAFDTVTIVVHPIKVKANPDTAVCFGDSVTLGASGALVYKWTGPEFDAPNQNRFPSILPSFSAMYFVEGSNFQKCSRYDSLLVTVFPEPEFELFASEDTFSGLENIKLIVQSNVPHHWISEGYVPCDTCDTIVVYPLYETKYYVEVIDSNRCVRLDSVKAEAISVLYVPSAFSPNGDGINDVLTVNGHNILKYQISIRDRWGHEVFASKDMNRGWNGAKFNRGKTLPIGVYSYEIRYTVLPDQDLHQVGTTTIVR
jgi:gliding motility-associated-like protein